MNEDDERTVLDHHKELMVIAHSELDLRIKALTASSNVLTVKGAAKGALAPGGREPGAVDDLIRLGEWLLKDPIDDTD